MRLAIDWTACEGRGICTELLPEVLAEDPWGYPMPRRDDLDVPPDLAAPARRAVHLCPRLALRLEAQALSGATAGRPSRGRRPRAS